MAAEFGSKLAVPCDVASDAEIESLFQQLKSSWGRLDGLVHAIAFAPREAIAGDFLDGLDARGIPHRARHFAPTALPRSPRRRCRCSARMRAAADPDLPRRGARRCRTTTPWASPRRASKRRCATWRRASGRSGIRVNGISAGPIKTLAAAGIGGFGKILKFVEEHAPLRRNVTTEDVGNAAAFLLSDLAAAVTGEILYVDAGFSHVMAGSLTLLLLQIRRIDLDVAARAQAADVGFVLRAAV